MRTTIARLTIMVSLVVAAFGAAAGCTPEETDDAERAGPKLDIGGNIALAAGEQVELTATLRDEGGVPSVVTKSPKTVWSVTNPSIASVVGGVVTGVAAGQTTVQATHDGIHSPARTVVVR